MTIERHPSSTLLTTYASGELPLAPALTINAHLARCAACSRRVRAVEETEGRLLADFEPVAIRAGAFEALLERLDAPADPGLTRPAVDDRLGDVHLPRAAAEAGFWPRRWVKPGLWVAHSRASRRDGWRTFLLRAPAGAVIPQHDHDDDELVCVLQGAFEDHARYGPGDFIQNVAGDRHSLRVTHEGPCACLISERGPIRWTGWTGKLLGGLLAI